MNPTNSNSGKLDILGNSQHSNQEIFNSVLKQWRKKVSYCTVFAAVPAILASNLPVSHSAEMTNPPADVVGRSRRIREQLNLSDSKRALLKRQSEFRLPHQPGNSNDLSPLSGVDDCPGRAIPGGNYTVAAPYIDSGDTTGANDTVTSLPSYYYYYGNYSAHGPDNVYTFTLTAHGPNAQIEVSTSSSTYKPLVYVIQDGTQACPAGTGNPGNTPWTMSDSRWDNGNKVTLRADSLPLNVPLHLFIDSDENDGLGSGPYTLRMQDV